MLAERLEDGIGSERDEKALRFTHIRAEQRKRSTQSSN
jgi:hypothetical protein